jgi:hypothetical protein
MPAIHFERPTIRAANIREAVGSWGVDQIITDRGSITPHSDTVLTFWFRTEAEARAMAARINGQPHVQAHETEAA